MSSVRSPERFRRSAFHALLLFLIGSSIASAAPPVVMRIHSPIEENDRFTLRGNTRPAVAKSVARSQGRLESSFVLPRMALHFAMTPAQQADLNQLLHDQQDRRSPQYHRFLGPEQFAARFGLADADLERIVRWLSESGFSNPQVARSKTWVSFSGTAARAESAFHISLHQYLLNGEIHYANSGDPQLPNALKGIVGGIRGFNNFRMKSFAQRARANFTLPDGMTHYLAPDDWAIIYNTKPLYAGGVDGSGVKIAVVGQSDVRMSDIEAFRAASGLSANDPTVIIPPGMQDPGVQTGSGDEVESDLDLEWAGAIARNAEIVFVTASGTTGEGVNDALTYAIDQNLAPIISVSYGFCEQDESTTDFQTMNSLLQQANAEGITIVAASGDEGPAACEAGSNLGTATHGYAVDFPASSALVSKPSWQSGTGVPADNARDVPDLAFAASPSHDAYLICHENSCRNGFFDLNNNVLAIGGTSAPTPSFAGVLALVIQQHGAGTRLGNVNPNLYSLAQFSSDIFHDVTSGDTDVPCQTTASWCTGSFLGFSAGVGYDQATGWGSIDAYQFAEQWFGDFQIAANPVTLTLQPGSSASAAVSLTPQNNFNGSVTFTCAVASSLADVSCSIPDTALTGSGTTTLTISAAATARSSWWKKVRRKPPAGGSLAVVAAGFVLLLGGTMFLSGWPRWRASATLLGMGVVSVCVFAVSVGCGGSSSGASSGSGSGSTSTPAPPPTLSTSCSITSPIITKQTYSFFCTASGGTGAYTFNVISGTLPMGLSLDPNTGMISGFPITPGTYSFTVQAADSGSPQQTATYQETNLTVTQSSYGIVALTCNLPPGALSGDQYSGSCSASGGMASYTYSIVAGVLPEGLTLNRGTGTISGVPVAAGTASFTIQAADSSTPPLTAEQTITGFTVGTGPLTGVSCPSLTGTGAHARYQAQCFAVGGQPPFTFAVTAGALPSGLSLDPSTGIVSGVTSTPSTNFENFTISATDSSNPARTASQAFSIFIYTTLPLSPYWPPAPGASVGVSYSAWCSIGGGNSPYAASIVSGQLPPGLQINPATGIISGAPTAMGTYALTMQIVDSSVPAMSTTVTNSITVGPRPSETGLVTVTATSGNIVSTTTVQVTVP